MINALLVTTQSASWHHQFFLRDQLASLLSVFAQNSCAEPAFFAWLLLRLTYCSDEQYRLGFFRYSEQDALLALQEKLALQRTLFFD